MVAVAEGGLDQLGPTPRRVQLAGDALAAPSLELALVLRELPGVASVVQQPGLGQLGYGMVDRLRLDPLALQAGAQLGDGALAPRHRLVGESSARSVSERPTGGTASSSGRPSAPAPARP